jgi:hypothetical protein
VSSVGTTGGRSILACEGLATADLTGIDHTRLTYRFQGRDFRLTDVHGEVGIRCPLSSPAA